MEINDIYYFSIDKLLLKTKRNDLRKFILINNLMNTIIRKIEEKWFDLILENLN